MQEQEKQHQSVLEMIKERGYVQRRLSTIQQQQERYKSAVRQRAKPMSELSTEFASMDKGYTPNRKELNMKKAYREALGNHPAGNAAIVLNAEDINGYGDLKGTSRKATDIKNSYKIQLQ